MKTVLNRFKFVLAVVALVLVVAPLASAQLIEVKELMEMRGKPIEELKASLEKKGWVYNAQCGSGDGEKRSCFKVGGGGEGLAAVLSIVQKGDEQLLEYAVYRPALIPKIQNNIRTGSFKLLRQNPIGEDVNLRIYQKNNTILIARGGPSKKYYSLEIMAKPAYDRLQASR